MKFTFGLFCILLVCNAAQALNHKHRVPEYRAFIPSRQSLLDQNAEADRLALPIIRTPAELDELVQSGEVVRLRTTPALRVTCPKARAYVRPWVAVFITGLAANYYAAFGKPLQVNSATRPQSVQRRLRRWNRNAAPIAGETASVHMRGIAVDLQRRGTTRQQRGWLQLRLMYWAARGAVLCEEELRQPCFHVVVRGNPPVIEPGLAGLETGALPEPAPQRAPSVPSI